MAIAVAAQTPSSPRQLTPASTVHFPPDAAPADAAPSSTDCPLAFASRLNSMADRPELWGGPHDVLGWVARQVCCSRGPVRLCSILRTFSLDGLEG